MLYQYYHSFINIIILLLILSFFYQYYHSFINIIILLSILSLFYHYYHYFIIIIYNRQQVNIDIGPKILKQKCLGCKTNFFNTHSYFPPAIEFQISSSIRISYSRPLFRHCFWTFSCGLGFAAWGRRRRRTDGTDGRMGRTDGRDGRTDRGRRRRTTATDGRDGDGRRDDDDDGYDGRRAKKLEFGKSIHFWLKNLDIIISTFSYLS